MTGLELTLAALRTHLAAVAWPRYEVRLIDSAQRACCATRYWTAGQLLAPTTARFLRARNRAGCKVYFRPHAGADSAGYLLLDFDAGPCPLADLRAAHHTPCIVVETSPGRQQAWLRVSTQTVSPSWATAVARGLAARYGADPASLDFSSNLPVERRGECQMSDNKGVSHGEVLMEENTLCCGHSRRAKSLGLLRLLGPTR